MEKKPDEPPLASETSTDEIREGDVFVVPNDGHEVIVLEIESWVTYGNGSHSRLSTFLEMVKFGGWKRKERPR